MLSFCLLKIDSFLHQIIPRKCYINISKVMSIKVFHVTCHLKEAPSNSNVYFGTGPSY